MRKILYLGIGFMLMFLVMPFAQVSAADSKVPQKYPGVYIADESSVSHDPYDPATNYETLGGSIIQEVYEGLYDYNGSDATSFRPILATGYTVSADGLNYTFTIRQNVNFTDGSPLNAYVFQYSILRSIIMNDPSSGIWILDQSVRNSSWIGGMNDVNVTQANLFMGNMSVHANSMYSLSIYLSAPSAAFIPELIFPTAYAVAPSWIIANEPSSYSTNHSDDTYGMVSLTNMFPGLDNATIRSVLGLSPTANLDNSGVVPQSAHDDAEVGYTYFANHLMGTGPYMLKSETAGVSIVLERNNNWWNKANFHKDSKGVIDAPQEVLLKVVPETETRILDVKNNEAHAAYIPLANLGEIMNPLTHVPYIDNINVYTYPSLTTGILGFNENATISAAGQLSQSNAATGYNNASIHSTTSPILQYSWKDKSGNLQYASPDNPFSSLLFRKAFAYAWDYEAYMNTVLNGQFNRLSGVIPEGLFGHQADLITAGYIPSQNLAQAKALFQQINWKGSVTVNYNSGNVERQKAAQLLANVIDNLGVGITIKIQEVQWSQFLSLNYHGGAAMFFLGWAPDYADASDYAVPFLHTGGLFPESMQYSNPHVDMLMDKADAMPNTNSTRNALYREMEINASQDFPYIYLYQANSVVVRNRWVVDWNSQYAGNENPMSWGTRFQYVGLEDYLPNTATTTPAPIASTSSSTSATSSSSQATSSSTSGQAPGFEAVAVLGLFAVGAIVVMRRRKA
jgi:peptide/nickel transport system substrate-binding protein